VRVDIPLPSGEGWQLDDADVLAGAPLLIQDGRQLCWAEVTDFAAVVAVLRRSA
jgi:hypothetical protein